MRGRITILSPGGYRLRVSKPIAEKHGLEDGQQITDPVKYYEVLEDQADNAVLLYESLKLI